MPSRIYKATIRKDERVEEVSIEQMNVERYEECKEDLFCPNPRCNARIVYVNAKSPHFRTRRYMQGQNQELIEQHIENCEYAVERSNVDIYTPRGDNSIIVQVTPAHIKNSLKRASRLTKVDDGTLTVTKRKSGNKPATKRTRVDETRVKGGKADLRNLLDELDEQKNKEPRIPHRNTENIAEKDYGKSIIIRGEIDKVVLEGEENSKWSYILLKSMEGKLTRILFGEYYQVHNEVQYGQIRFYKKYCEELKKQGKKIRVACAGDVIQDEFLFSINMVNYDFIVINELAHYEIVNQYMMK